MNLDHSVYPDLARADLPTTLDDDAARADYVARICGAWDFGILPTPETFGLLRGWPEIFRGFALVHSPAWRAFHVLYGWDVPSAPGASVVRSHAETVDRRAGRCVDETVV